MAYEPLHHKYRPQTFAELVGQEAIAQTLSNALTSNRIAPAYLFTGPRGTGKTSSSRILAKSLNCLNSDGPTPHPCGKCQICDEITRGVAMDIVEIDAASNTGVDNIREIIERTQFAPVQCRYKVYVIDECHMLSTAAFNALLKTLEEPPDRVVFVLATTDPQRVLNTIISRCQRFDFRRIPLQPMVRHLTQIAQNEAIAISPEALTLVAQLANGGLRDAESLLDQLSLLSGEIVPEKVWDLVGAVPEQDLLKLIQALRSNDPEATIAQCRAMLDRGREPMIVLQNLATFYLNLLLAKTSPQNNALVAVTAPTWAQLCEESQYWQIPTILQSQQRLKESEVQLRNTTQPRLWLEVTLLGLLPDAIAPVAASPVQTQRQPIQQPPQRQPSPQPLATPPRSQPSPTPQSQPISTPRSQPPATPQTQPPQPSPQTAAVAPSPRSVPNMSPQPVPSAGAIAPDTATRDAQFQREVWQRALGRMKMFTRSFLEQHCQITQLDVEDCTVTLGVASAGRLNFAKGKSAEITAAFEQVFAEPFQVNFVVRDPNQAHQSGTRTPSSPPRSAPTAPPFGGIGNSARSTPPPSAQQPSTPPPANNTPAPPAPQANPHPFGDSSGSSAAQPAPSPPTKSQSEPPFGQSSNPNAKTRASQTPGGVAIAAKPATQKSTPKTPPPPATKPAPPPARFVVTSPTAIKPDAIAPQSSENGSAAIVAEAAAEVVDAEESDAIAPVSIMDRTVQEFAADFEGKVIQFRSLS